VLTLRISTDAFLQMPKSGVHLDAVLGYQYFLASSDPSLPPSPAVVIERVQVWCVCVCVCLCLWLTLQTYADVC
jgi:hypothetical protein